MRHFLLFRLPQMHKQKEFDIAYRDSKNIHIHCGVRESTIGRYWVSLPRNTNLVVHASTRFQPNRYAMELRNYVDSSLSECERDRRCDCDLCKPKYCKANSFYPECSNNQVRLLKPRDSAHRVNFSEILNK